MRLLHFITEKKIQPLDVDVLKKKFFESLEEIARREGKEVFQKEMEGGKWKKSMTYERWLKMFLDAAEYHFQWKTDGLNLQFEIPFSFAGGQGSYILQVFEKDLEQWFENRGWYIKARRETGMDGTLYSVEPNYGKVATIVPETLYHATEVSSYESILRKGLYPQKQQKIKHKGRIYVAINFQKAYEIAQMLGSWESDYGEDVNPMVILKIDKSKLPKGTKFYIDPDFPSGGLYTYTPIPASAISLNNDKLTRMNVETWKEQG